MNERVKQPVKTTLFAIGASLLLLLAALALVPFFLQDRVVELVRSQLNERLEATVDFEDVDLSLLSTFPTFTVEIVGLEIFGKGVFEGNQLASIRSLGAGVELLSLIRDEQLLIESLIIDHLELHLLVNEDGGANYDIVKDSDDEPEAAEADAEPESLALRLRQFQITGGLITYEAPGTQVSIEGLDHDGSAMIDGATYTVASSTTVEALSFRLGRIRYLKEAKVGLDVSAILRADDQHLRVDQLEIAVNELTGEGSGDIEWRDDAMELDLELASGKGQSLRALVTAIPNAYAGDFAGLRARGTYSLGAKIKGQLGPDDDDVPSFSAHLFVRNGTLQHPDLALPLTDIALDAKLKHPGGSLDKMKIDVPSYAARAGQSHVSGRFAMATPLSRPGIALVVDGRLDMAEIAQAYPISDVEDLQGSATVRLDFTVKGDHVERLTGGIAASGIVVRPSDAPPLEISTIAVSFAPKETEVRTFHSTYGRSDISATGSLSPFDVILDALLGDDETITGDLKLTSKLIDMNEFSDEDFPFKVDVGLFLDLKKLIYKKQVLSNLRGSARYKDNKLTLTDVVADAQRYVQTSLSSLVK